MKKIEKKKGNEAKLIIILTVVLIASWFNSKKYKPMKSNIAEVEQNINLLESSLKDLGRGTGLSGSSNLKKTLGEIQKEYHGIKSKKKQLIVNFPKITEFDVLLSALSDYENKSSVQFIEIKPELKSFNSKNNNSNQHSFDLLGRLETFIKIRASYKDAHQYMNYVESITSKGFISQANFEVLEENSLIEMSLLYTLFISKDKSQGALLELNTTQIKNIDLPKSPFKKFAKEEPKEKVEEVSVTPDFLIQGILKAGDIYRVIVNEKIYQAGQEIDSFKITNIEQNKMIIEKSGKIYEVFAS